MTTNPFDEDYPEVESLARMMDAVLEAVVNVYDQAGVDLPERRYWTLGETVADCEQLTLFVNQIYVGPPGDEAGAPQRCDGPRSANINVQVLRCIPTVSARGTRAPTAEQIQEGSRPLAHDMYLLLDSAAQLERWDPYAGPGLGVIATVDATPPQGGYQAVNMTLTMAIP